MIAAIPMAVVQWNEAAASQDTDSALAATDPVGPQGSGQSDMIKSGH
ncbi:MAG: hypothetical protein ACOYMP_05725 [Nodosilinea sp.]